MAEEVDKGSGSWSRRRSPFDQDEGEVLLDQKRGGHRDSGEDVRVFEDDSVGRRGV